MHRELAGELGAERIGYRPTDALMTAAADAEDLERYRRLPNPAWLDGHVVAHEVIGAPGTTAQVDPRAFTEAVMEDALAHGADLLVGMVEGMRFHDDGTVRAVVVDGVEHAADLPAQVVFSEFVARDGRWVTFRIYPRAGRAVYVTGHPEHAALPDDPADIVPEEASVRELRRIAGVHASALDASPFALTRLPAGRMSSGMGDSAP
jgi:FAD dependent oxidoreductase